MVHWNEQGPLKPWLSTSGFFLAGEYKSNSMASCSPSISASLFYIQCGYCSIDIVFPFITLNI